MPIPETIQIDKVEYVRADKVKTLEGDIKIVVADRGFVYIGVMSPVTEESAFVELNKAQNIRVWGTTKGLGELVNGPTPSTKLDPVGTMKIPMRAVISIINVDSTKWKTL